MIHGSIVAIVTPFKNGAVDYGKLEELIEFHIELSLIHISEPTRPY